MRVLGFEKIDRSGEKRVKKDRGRGNCYPVPRISTIIFVTVSQKISQCYSAHSL